MVESDQATLRGGRSAAMGTGGRHIQRSGVLSSTRSAVLGGHNNRRIAGAGSPTRRTSAIRTTAMLLARDCMYESSFFEIGALPSAIAAIISSPVSREEGAP